MSRGYRYCCDDGTTPISSEIRDNITLAPGSNSVGDPYTSVKCTGYTYTEVVERVTRTGTAKRSTSVPSIDM